MKLSKDLSIADLLEQNSSRLSRAAAKYIPVKGIGSPIARRKLYISRGKYVLIPEKMAEIPQIAQIIICGSITSFAKKKKIEKESVEEAVTRVRMAYDFEYWCFCCVKIQDKQTKRMVPLVMRQPQLKLLSEMHNALFDDKPVRVIVLKARQWGGSTLVQIFMAWIQLFHRKGWHSVIVADIEDQSRNIKAMYSRLAKYHPAEIFEIKFKNFEGSSKNKLIEGRDCVVYLGSMQKPDALRSADVMMAHLSEVGLWRETDGKKPEDVVQSIAGTVPLEPYSVIVMESTAKGVGSFFHRQWQKAVSGESGYTPVFVAWFEIDIYAKAFTSDAERENFARTLTAAELEYFRLGATLEAINWYRSKKHGDSYDDWRMACEFPTTPQEAFQSTGRRAHPPTYVSSMRSDTCAPSWRGDVVADVPRGKGALGESLRFEESVNGNLWLWSFPDAEQRVPRRYVVSMDIGGRSHGADFSVISIIDRYWLYEGGVEECIGTFRFHLDQDLAVWKAVQLARLYHNALLVVEANSLNAKGEDGDHTLTILDEIKDYYPNLYSRTDPQRVIEGAPQRYGFFTSRASKTDLVNQMNKRFRERGYIERDARALDEADCYEIKDDGSYGAVDGQHDDVYMSRAIGLKASSLL